MKFIVTKNIILKSLSHEQSIVEKKNTLPILSNILIEAKDNNLILSSTDMDISITDKINCNVLEKGSTTINAHTIYDIIRKLPENSEIEVISNDGKLLNLRSGNSRFSLGCLPKEDFPIIEVEDIGNKINIDSQSLLKLIDKTKFSISNEETRYFLNGLYFSITKKNESNFITIVGTDGHRLAKMDYINNDLKEEIPGVIIPKKTINELSKLLSDYLGDIEININPADLRIDTYRASGAGGQHVNKTESAVRITHLPTSTVVQCQDGRSQHANKDQAMKQLKSKLFELEMQKRNSEKQDLEDLKSDIGWGHQIRSYVLDQSRIKDLRTGVESSNTQDVLDGNLDQFIEASLKAGL